MNADELAKGKKLADDSLAWHRSTMPGFEDYSDEPIPLFVKWFKQVALPELENSIKRAEENDELVKIRQQSRRKK